MRFLSLFWVFCLSLWLSGCAITTTNENYTQAVSSWRWGTLHLLRIWGNPTQITDLPNGNRLYIYLKETYKNYPAPPPTAAVNTIQVPMGKSFMVVPASETTEIGSSFFIHCRTSFEIDPREIIVNVRAEGNDCTADGGFIYSRANPTPREMPAPEMIYKN